MCLLKKEMERSKGGEIKLIINFNILDRSIAKHIFLKKIYKNYNINIKKYINLRKKYDYRSNILFNNNENYLFYYYYQKGKFKEYEFRLNNNESSEDIIPLVEQRFLFLELSLVEYSLNYKNYYNILRYNLKYNKFDLKTFRLNSVYYFEFMEYEYEHFEYIKNCINIFSKVLMKEGKYINVYTIMEYALFSIRLKELDIYLFFQAIFEKLYLPINLYKKKVAGRKLLVPNPYNLNYMDKRLWASARFIERSLLNRKEKSFKDRFISELFDIYYDNGESLCLKKRNEIINIIQENRLNLRYLKRKK